MVICIWTQRTFFCTFARPARPFAGLFSCSRLRGTQGGRVYTINRRKFGPRPGSVARALGVQSRANWQVITGSLSAEPEPRKTMETPHLHFLAIAHSCMMLPLYHICITTVSQTLKLSTLWQPRYNSSRTSGSSLCDRHRRCICVCACACHSFCLLYTSPSPRD